MCLYGLRCALLAVGNQLLWHSDWWLQLFTASTFKSVRCVLLLSIGIFGLFSKNCTLSLLKGWVMDLYIFLELEHRAPFSRRLLMNATSAIRSNVACTFVAQAELTTVDDLCILSDTLALLAHGVNWRLVLLFLVAVNLPIAIYREMMMMPNGGPYFAPSLLASFHTGFCQLTLTLLCYCLDLCVFICICAFFSFKSCECPLIDIDGGRLNMCDFGDIFGERKVFRCLCDTLRSFHRPSSLPIGHTLDTEWVCHEMVAVAPITECCRRCSISDCKSQQHQLLMP